MAAAGSSVTTQVQAPANRPHQTPAGTLSGWPRLAAAKPIRVSVTVNTTTVTRAQSRRVTSSAMRRWRRFLFSHRRWLCSSGLRSRRSPSLWRGRERGVGIVEGLADTDVLRDDVDERLTAPRRQPGDHQHAGDEQEPGDEPDREEVIDARVPDRRGLVARRWRPRRPHRGRRRSAPTIRRGPSSVSRWPARPRLADRRAAC